ncbi:MAG: luciferase [Chloroflexi bacterium RBG_16_54_18]|nr:MAG: luciferase [Chloroflexi bacterium RBG_16_54_18]
MKYGFVLPYGDAAAAGELAELAENCEWDGFFVWEPVWGYDAWILLAAAAMRTEKIRLGTMISPLSRMRPWKLASETITLDHLSAGRLVLSVGLGAVDTGFAEFGEITDRRMRAEMLDEGLEILTGLWRGQPFTYEGKHYQIQPVDFYPPPAPLQKPRIPIWVVGAWPRRKSMRRALRYDGILPNKLLPDGTHTPVIPEDIRQINAWIVEHRENGTPFDIIVEGVTSSKNKNQTKKEVLPWIDAGATWWIEALWSQSGVEQDLRTIRNRINDGPPVI